MNGYVGAELAWSRTGQTTVSRYVGVVSVGTNTQTPVTKQIRSRTSRQAWGTVGDQSRTSIAGGSASLAHPSHSDQSVTDAGGVATTVVQDVPRQTGRAHHGRTVAGASRTVAGTGVASFIDSVGVGNICRTTEVAVGVVEVVARDAGRAGVTVGTGLAENSRGTDQAQRVEGVVAERTGRKTTSAQEGSGGVAGVANSRWSTSGAGSHAQQTTIGGSVQIQAWGANRHAGRGVEVDFAWNQRSVGVAGGAGGGGRWAGSAGQGASCGKVDLGVGVH